MKELKHLLSFQGRSGRKTYWLVSFLIWAPISLFVKTVNRLIDQGFQFSPLFMWASLLVFGPVCFIGLWATIATAVRRCHDRNHSGFFLFFGLIPVIGQLVIFIELGCRKGIKSET